MIRANTSRLDGERRATCTSVGSAANALSVGARIVTFFIARSSLVSPAASTMARYGPKVADRDAVLTASCNGTVTTGAGTAAFGGGAVTVTVAAAFGGTVVGNGGVVIAIEVGGAMEVTGSDGTAVVSITVSATMVSVAIEVSEALSSLLRSRR